MTTLGNFTTNLAESLMHICSKFDGGKQINRSQAGSWQGRCAKAGLHCNEGTGWGPTTRLSTQRYLMSLSLLQLMPLNTLTMIESVRLQLLPSYNVKRHDIVSIFQVSVNFKNSNCYLCGCRHDGGTQALGVPTDVPGDQLKELMIRCYV